MKLRIAAVGLLVAAVALSAWLVRPAPLDFAPSVEAALARARGRGDWVVVHLRRADRPLGAQMDQETLADPQVARGARDGFVHVRLDAESGTTRVTPALAPGAALATLVLDQGGAVVAELDGFATATELLGFLDRVRSRRATLRDPATPRVARAEVLFELGALASAEREIAALPAQLLPDDDARAGVLRGRLELARGHLEEAKRTLCATVERYPATSSARDAAMLLQTLSPR